MRTSIPTTPRLIAILLVTAATTAIGTRTLVGQLTARDQIPPAQQVRFRHGEVKVVPRVPVHNDPPFQLPPPDVARSASLGSFDVRLDGRTIVVTGAARVYETEAAHYVWSLRVFKNTNGMPLFREHHYVDQAVWPAENQTSMKPQFADQFELPPGAYKIQLTLYAVSPDFDFGTLKVGEEIKNRVHLGLSRHRRIVVE